MPIVEYGRTGTASFDNHTRFTRDAPSLMPERTDWTAIGDGQQLGAMIGNGQP